MKTVHVGQRTMYENAVKGYVGLVGSLTLLPFAFCQYLRRILANLAPFATAWLQSTTHAVAFFL